MILSKGANKVDFLLAIRTTPFQEMINHTLQDEVRAKRFVAAVTSAVSINPALRECDAGSVLQGALLGESLGLSPSPQLGQYYLVPFEVKVKDGNGKQVCDEKGNPVTQKVATFIPGYKGYKVLAMNSGVYKSVVSIPVKKGELKEYDPFTNHFRAEAIADPSERESAETVGYFGRFELLNGYSEIIYWTKEKMVRHAEKYSPAFGKAPKKGNFPGRVSFADYQAGKYPKGDEWAYSSFWYKDFDGMACKTIVRQLLSKGAPLSTEMRMAFEADGMPIDKDLTPEYVPNEDIEEFVGIAADSTPEQPELESDVPLSLADI